MVEPRVFKIPTKLTEQEKGHLEATMNIKWDDDPSLGGIIGSCRFCGEEHPGKVCRKIRNISFYANGSVKSIRLKGGDRNGETETPNEVASETDR